MAPHVAPRRIGPDVVIIQLDQSICDENEHVSQAEKGRSKLTTSNTNRTADSSSSSTCTTITKQTTAAVRTVLCRHLLVAQCSKPAEPYAGCLVDTPYEYVCGEPTWFHHGRNTTQHNTAQSTVVVFTPIRFPYTYTYAVRLGWGLTTAGRSSQTNVPRSVLAWRENDSKATPAGAFHLGARGGYR